jgi:hypothetical protein
VVLFIFGLLRHDFRTVTTNEASFIQNQVGRHALFRRPKMRHYFIHLLQLSISVIYDEACHYSISRNEACQYSNTPIEACHYSNKYNERGMPLFIYIQ